MKPARDTIRRILVISPDSSEEVEEALNNSCWVTVMVKDFWQAALRIKTESFSAVVVLADSSMMMTAAIMLRAANATLPIAFVLDYGLKRKSEHFRETITETIPNLRIVEADKLQSFLQSI